MIFDILVIGDHKLHLPRIGAESSAPYVPDPNGVAVSLNGSGAKTGVDWDNAMEWPDDAAFLERDSHYYLDDTTQGTPYVWPTLDTPEDGEAEIWIVKANETQHGPAGGWSPTFGDGQAWFDQGVVGETGYWKIDGQTGPTADDWRRGCGIVIPPTDSNNGGIVNTQPSVTLLRWIVQNVHFFGPDNPGGPGSDNGKPVGIYCENMFEWLISNNRFDGMGSNAVRGNGSRNIFQRNLCEYFANTVSNHGEQISFLGGTEIEDNIIRWNLVNYAAGTGAFAMNDSLRTSVYGNVFAPHGDLTLTGGNGLLAVVTDSDLIDALFAYNTIISSTCPIIGDINVGDSGVAKNNLLYDSLDYGTMSAFDCTHNHFASSGAGVGTNATTSSGNPFVDWLNDNFRLLANTTPGAVLVGTDINTDWYGRPRTTRTRGAIEF